MTTIAAVLPRTRRIKWPGKRMIYLVCAYSTTLVAMAFAVVRLARGDLFEVVSVAVDAWSAFAYHGLMARAAASSLRWLNPTRAEWALLVMYIATNGL